MPRHKLDQVIAASGGPARWARLSPEEKEAALQRAGYTPQEARSVVTEASSVGRPQGIPSPSLAQAPLSPGPMPTPAVSTPGVNAIGAALAGPKEPVGRHQTLGTKEQWEAAKAANGGVDPEYDPNGPLVYNDPRYGDPTRWGSGQAPAAFDPEGGGADFGVQLDLGGGGGRFNMTSARPGGIQTRIGGVGDYPTVGGVNTPGANSLLGDVGGVFGDAGKAVGGALGGIGKFIANPKNSQLVTGLAGTAANVYGAHKAGAAQDRELEFFQEREKARQEEERKRREDRRYETIINAIAGTI